MSTPNEIKNDFRLLKDQIQNKGYFNYPRQNLVTEIFIIFALFGIAVTIRPSSHLLSIALASIGGITLVWWIHNAGHDAFFKSKQNSKFGIEFLGILFLGMPQIEYHYEVHRRHHGFTNIIGKDGALDTGPIRWHAKMYTKENPDVLKFQSWIWLFLVLPLTWPLITFRCVQTLIERKNYVRLSAFTLRWIAVPFLVEFDFYFIVIPIIVTGFVLGFVASLNHFHMEMDDKPLAEFPSSVFLVTQNLSHRGFVMTWLTGGLNFHIEHHLFPTLPSWTLRKISPLVQDFATRHGLPYHTGSLPMATLKLYRRLNDPISETAESPNQEQHA